MRLWLGVRVGGGFELVTYSHSTPLPKMTSGQFAGWKIVLTVLKSVCQAFVITSQLLPVCAYLAYTEFRVSGDCSTKTDYSSLQGTVTK